jgi:outer membrane protein assembly factor BamA
VSAVGPTFTYDNTNDPFLPSLGWRLNGTYEEAFRFFAGDVRFHKLESRVGRFDTLGGWTLFEGLQAGAIRPHSSSGRNIIPIYERYFLGGANTVRGYSERQLGPRDEAGDPLGGNAFLVGNFEIRHRIWKQLFGVTFIDGGQIYGTDPGHVWPQMRMTKLDDFRYGTGFGVRFHSPVGAIRLEMGYKLNSPDGKRFFKDRTAVHFSIGEVF